MCWGGWEIDDWYIQERFPTEDCLLFPEKCAECLAERKQCLLNLFKALHGEEEKTQEHMTEHHGKSSQEIKKG